MKILIVNTLYPPIIHGGAELSVQALATGLVGCGDSVRVLTLGERSESCVEQGVQISRFKVPNLYWPFDQQSHSALSRTVWHCLDVFNMLAKKKVQEQISDFRPDLVHTNNLGGFSAAATWSAIEASGIPTVHTTRDYYLLCPRGNMYKRGHSCETQCGTCKFMRGPAKIKSEVVGTAVGISRFVLDIHKSYGYFQSANDEVIFNAVANAVSPFPSRNVQRGSALRLGFIGRLSDDKGLIELLESFHRMSKRNWTLSVAGAGDARYVRRAQTVAKGLPVEFVGRKPVYSFLADVDVLLVPSRWAEPFARVIAEAFIAGRPVLASSNGAIPELVKSGENGYLCDMDDPLALEVALDMMAEPTNYERLQAGAIGCADQFLVSTVTDRYRGIYARAINE